MYEMKNVWTDNVISFIPPDGKCDDSNNIRIPFDMMHNTKYELDSIHFDIGTEVSFTCNGKRYIC